jgi:hypothetical protein
MMLESAAAPGDFFVGTLDLADQSFPAMHHQHTELDKNTKIYQTIASTNKIPFSTNMHRRAICLCIKKVKWLDKSLEATCAGSHLHHNNIPQEVSSF